MDFGVQTVDPYASYQQSGYFDAVVQPTPGPQQNDTWSTTLMTLYNQRSYLEGLLSKTATTLNALRDKQTRNERVLVAYTGPRSKKKKVLQNRWRTEKTIKTCENEERVIIGCLQVCQSNINTLESMMHTTESSTTAAEYDWSTCQSYIETESTTDFDWNGWDDCGVSPFQKPCHHPLVLDEVPPDSPACCDPASMPASSRKPPPLPPRDRVQG